MRVHRSMYMIMPLMRLLLLTLSGLAAAHAQTSDGWFEVSRGYARDGVLATSSVAARPEETRVQATDSASRVAAFGESLGNGWQAVPSIRQASGDVAAVRFATEAADSARLPGLVSRPAGPANAQTAESLGTLMAAPAPASAPASASASASAMRADPLILTRGEIHELGGRPLPIVPREAAISHAPQQQRNRLPSSAVNTVNVDMFAGEVKVLGKVDVDRVAIGNGDIVRAEVLKTGELLVIAETEGSTSLRLWHSDKTQSDYNIRVSSSDPETRVRMETMVRMRVRMVEFRKSALGKLGIDWSDSAAGPGFAIAGDAVGNNLFRLPSDGLSATLPNTVKPFSTYFGVASSITSRINFLASTGDATTLAEPVLSTTNGGSASFLAGGEVPYPSIGANGQTVVQFKEYGIKLNVSPSIDALGNVRTLVETEISQLDPAVSVQGAPGLLTRRAQTQVNVRSGETIVISGLLSSESSKDVDKLPGIGNLPVIGSFFRSRNARNSVSELVIFVTPEIVEPGGQLLSTRQQEFLDSSNQQLSRAQGQIQLLD